MTKLIEFIAVLFIVIVIALISIVALTDINQYKGQITQAVEKATGRQLIIDGDIELSWSLVPTISVEGVRFSNASWGSEPQMLSVDQFLLQIALKPLLSGDIEINKLILIKPTILVETNKEGLSNWQLSTSDNHQTKDDSSSNGLSSIYLSQVVIEDAQFIYKEGLSGQQQKLIIDSLLLEAENMDSEIDVVVDATYNTVDVAVKGHVGAINQFIENTSYPVDVMISLPDSSLAVNGNIEQPLEGKGIAVTIEAKAQNLSAISTLIKDELPEYGDISIKTQLTSHSDRYQLENIDLQVGESNLMGDIVLALNDPRPNVTATLSSTKIDINQFLPESKEQAEDVLVDETEIVPNESETQTASIIPVNLIPFESIARSLRIVDADITLQANEIKIEQDEINNTELHVMLSDGHLVIAPLTSSINGGLVSLELDLESSNEQLQMAINLDAESLEKISYLSGLSLPELAPISINGTISADRSQLSFADLDLVAGKSNLSGYAKVELEGDKPTIIADLSSTKLNIVELMSVNSLVGDASTQQEPQTSSTNQTLISADLIPIDDIQYALSLLNADIKIKADDVILPQGQLTDTVLDLQLHDGLLNVSPVSSKIDGNAFSGTMELMTEQDAISLRLDSHLDSLTKLSSITGVALPDLAPVEISGKFSATGQSYEINDLTLVAGSNDLSGNFKAELTGKRPTISGDLVSNNLDFTTFESFDEPAKELKPVVKEKADTSDRLFSSEPIDLAIMKIVDANVSLAAKKIQSTKVSLENTVMTLALKNGELNVEPISFLAAGGQLSGRLSVDSSSHNIALDTDLTITGLEPNKVTDLKEKLTGGKTDVVLKVKGEGESVSQIMAGLNGVFSVNVGDAIITDSISGALGADVVKKLVNMVNPFAEKKQGTDLKCAVVKFDIEDGIATTKKGIAVSTAQMNIIGSGVIDLKTEKINIGIKPEAREGFGVNAAKLASMVRIAGTLSSPKPIADITGTLTTGYSLTQAVATGGLSLLAEGLFSRLTADSNPCATALGIKTEDAESEPVLAPETIQP